MTDIDILAQSLALDARNFANQQAAANGAARTFVVVDFEYLYDTDRHHGYKTAEGKGAEESVRWPFHRVVAASWAVIAIVPGCTAPLIEPLVVVAGDATEADIAARFFAMLAGLPDAVLISWGGEQKDWPVLRRCAAEHGLVLPRQLRDLAPHAPSRLDLCNAVSTQAACVHLPEYAAACSIPAKPSPSKEIGELVQRGDWNAVGEQVLADVMTTAVIGLRHLASHGTITCDLPQACAMLATRAAEALPCGTWAPRTLAPWARALVARSMLKGTVFRAAD
jgi:Predicted 3'-5' exonuclease related to the exonuclease domain of PolB